MATKVSIGNMADAIMKELNEYADTTADGVKAAVQKAAKTVKTEIQAGAPARTGAYKKSWATKNTAESSNKLEITVYSRNRYPLPAKSPTVYPLRIHLSISCSSCSIPDCSANAICGLAATRPPPRLA